MKLYKATINPTSNFASSLKGDTLFGQICWGILYSLGKKKLTELMENYKDKNSDPFLIVSDGFPKGYLPKPKMPSKLLNENSENKKVNRKKIWLKFDELKNGEYSKAKTDKEIKNCDKSSMIIHNSLNYKTFHTHQGFDPYGVEEFYYDEKDIFFLLDERQLTLEELKKAFDLVSQMGYGKDTTIGKGRFKFDEFKEFKIDNNSKYFMTLSPFSPEDLVCKNLYYEPITKFGKFGAKRANKNAFKKPIIMANTASVVIFENEKKCKYIGKHIDKISDLYKDSIHQGYSIVIPIGVKK